MMIEVRCCCTPTKLLGWLPLGDPAYLPTVLRFRYVEGAPDWRAMDPTRLHEAIDAAARVVELELPVRSFGTCALLSRRALKSEDTPIEVLRLIRGFVENPTPDEMYVDPPFKVLR